MPFFSVVIPLFNKEDYITSTLNSVFKQSFTDFELLIVNDGSTDNSFAIAKKLCKNKKNVILFSQENKGLSAARNYAIRQANGTVIALLDADDFWNSNYLKELKFLYDNFKEASLYGTNYIEYYNKNLQVEPTLHIAKALKKTAFLIEDFFKASIYQPITNPSSFAFKKEVFNFCTFNESIEYAEDIDFYIKTNLNYRFAYSYNPLVYIRTEIPNQMTKVGFKGKKLANLNTYNEEAKNNTSLKKYLNTYRYYIAVTAKATNDTQHYQKLKAEINQKELTKKQRFLLNAPKFLVLVLQKIKKLILKKNIRVTSY